MPAMTLEMILKLYGIASDIYDRAKAGRDEARRIALAAGVTEEMLAAADARFARDYFPNPDAPAPAPEPPRDDPSVARYSVLASAIAVATALGGYGVVSYPDGYGLWPLSVGPAPAFVWKP